MCVWGGRVVVVGGGAIPRAVGLSKSQEVTLCNVSLNVCLQFHY
jgi:hypothetical protein